MKTFAEDFYHQLAYSLIYFVEICGFLHHRRFYSVKEASIFFKNKLPKGLGRTHTKHLKNGNGQ